MRTLLNNAVAVAALLLAACHAYAAVGFIQFAAGDVRIRNGAGDVRTAVKGAQLDEGDTILTGAAASAQVKMSDGGILAVRPQTELKLDTYRYAGKEDGSERAVMSLVKGGFRTITGAIGRSNKQNYTVNTPTAVIGIRGTDHEAVVIPVPPAGVAAGGPAPGTYDKVNVGQAYIRTPLGEVNIRQNQVGYAAPNQAPTLLPKLPDFFKATPPVRQAQPQKEGGASSEKTAEASTAAEGRATTAIDSTASTATSGGDAGSTTAGAATAVAPPAVTQTVSARSEGGQSLNLTSQTLQTATGETVSLDGTHAHAATTSNTTVLVSYGYANPFPQFRTNRYEGPAPINPILDETGNPIGVINYDPLDDKAQALALVGGTATPSGGVRAGHYASTGISMGWHSASPDLIVAGQDFDSTFVSRTVLPDGLFWLRGPSPTPRGLPTVISSTNATATYTLDGYATPRDHNGNAGTLNAAALSVNFNKQAVDFRLDVTTAAGNWLATASDVRMDDSGGFSAFTSPDTTTPAGADTHRRVFVTRNNSDASIFGSVHGQLMGAGANGAGIIYAFGDFNGASRVSGAAAFVGPTQDAAAPYYLIGMTAGMEASGTTFSDRNTAILGGYVSAGRTQFVDGYPVRVDAEYRLVATPTSCATCVGSSTAVPAVYAVGGATGVASVGNAALLDAGKDPVTGLTWGRYGGTAGATIGVTDRISGASLATMDVSQQSVHFIASSLQSGPVSLPVTGTASYTLIGHTNPTDNLGNVGTLGSATFTANFAARTVDTAISLSVANANWAASASRVPIVDGTFEAKKGISGGGLLSITRNGGAGNTAGQIVGAFTGPGGAGAAMLYSLNQGGHASAGGTTVSGVAAFRK